MEAGNLSVWLHGLGKTSLQAAVLVVAILVIQAVFRKQLSPRWRAGLWLLVAGRLLLPVSFSSAASLFNLLPGWPTPVPNSATATVKPQATELVAPRPEVFPIAGFFPPHPAPRPTPAIPQDATLAKTELEPSSPAAGTASAPSTASAAVAPARPKLSLHQLLLAVWLGGVVILFGYLGVTSVRLTRRFAGLQPTEDPTVLAILDECRTRMRVAGRLQVVESDAISTPALHGFLRPRLLLPRGFAAAFTADELRFVMLHELAHVKRHDLLVNWLAALLQAVYWFNPFVWLAFHRWRADRELACDALALETAGPERHREYGRTILRLLRDFTHRAPVPGMVGILEDHRQLTRRIQMIASFKPAKRLGALSLVIGAALGLVCLTDAQVASKRGADAKAVSGGAATATTAAEVVDTNAATVTYTGADPAPNETTNEVLTVTLTVVEAASGKPVPGAEVIADYLPQAHRRLTDSQGRYVIKAAIPPKQHRSRSTHFSISASHPDFARRTVAWTSSGGDVYAAISPEATIKLDPGSIVGGVVRDAQGKPLPGVKVGLQGSTYRGFSMGGAEQKYHEYSDIYQVATSQPATVTDDAGRWTFNHFPADLKTVEVGLTRPDESRYVFSTAPGVNGINTYAPISLNDLLAGKAVIILPDGIRVRGLVVDETGTPLAGVLVKEGYGHGNVQRVSEVRTGPDGRFERLNRAPRQWIYTATADGRATVSVVAQVEPGLPEVRLVLPPAQPLRLRFNDDRGAPIAGVSLTLDTYRNDGQLLDWSAKTDETGRVVWTNAPLTPFFVQANSPAGAFKKFRVQANGAEQTLVLGKPATNAVVTVKAVDAHTRKPVTLKTVYRELNGDHMPKKLAEPGQREFQTTLAQGDWQVGMGMSYKIKVEADGYEPGTTEYIDLSEGDQHLELELQPGGPVSGVARFPDGSLAAGARIWVQADRNAGSLFCNSPGRYYGDRLFKAAVDAEGRFDLPVLTEDPPVVFTHTNGVLQTTLSKLKSNPAVTLDRWSRLEGRVFEAGKPKPKVRVNLGSLHWSPDLGLNLIYNTTSDEEGRFAFDMVPAGEYKLYRHQVMRIGRSITEDHPMPLVVKAGEVLKVDYAGSGRAVIGQVNADKPEVAVDWLNDDHVLMLKQPPVPAVNREDFASFKAFTEANRNAYRSPARLQLARNARTYVLSFERDGSFRAEDVPPGTYQLKIHVTKPGEGQRNVFPRPEDDLALFITEVTVPEGEGAFDLGVFTIPIQGAAPASREEPLDFAVRNLDGETVTLKSLRGKPLILAIWATWSPRSKEQLDALNRLYGSAEGGTRFRWLSVCLDSEPGAVRKRVVDGGYAGDHALADRETRAKLAAALDVETLPAIFLLDETGRVIARDLEEHRLPLALQRALKGK